MEPTNHRIYQGDASNLTQVEDNSIDLVVTSPPYPMIAMWDKLFAAANPQIKNLLEQGDGAQAFEKMHLILDQAWAELFRVMKPGALACINIGDATRSLNRSFALFPNQARLQNALLKNGFTLLPRIIWRKQTNSPNKFMGSGMLPGCAYVTLEHEIVVIARKGRQRCYKNDDEKELRRQSSYFWEERNIWFSDVWDFKGTRQEEALKQAGRRSAAFPLEMPFRLINMHSLIGDTILDPFLGTGTTSVAAAAAGRNSIGFELSQELVEAAIERLAGSAELIKGLNPRRLEKHREFIIKHEGKRKQPEYYNEHCGFSVITRQEVKLRLPLPENVYRSGPQVFTVTYS